MVAKWAVSKADGLAVPKVVKLASLLENAMVALRAVSTAALTAVSMAVELAE